MAWNKGAQPATPKRHILVAVTGNTPQIVTETLYVLAVAQRPPVPISAVYILTTARGAEIAWAKLGGEQGAIAALQREYEIPGEIVFRRENILVFKRRSLDGRETPLEDIRSSEDNETLASELLGFVQALTDDPNVVLHCSLGGGRRTMSAYMLLALMMYGREEDELTHVVVTEEFETNPDFYFPPKISRPMAVRLAGNRLDVVNTSEAKLELARIPFVRLRKALGEDIGKVEQGLNDLITIAQRQLDRAPINQLVIDLRRRRAQFGTHTIALRGIQLALLAHYADIKLTRCAEPQRPVCADCRSCYANPAQDDAAFRALYQSFYTGTLDQLKEGAEGKLDSQILMSYHSKINKALRALSFKIESERQYGGTTYGLNLDKNLIRILR